MAGQEPRLAIGTRNTRIESDSPYIATARRACGRTGRPIQGHPEATMDAVAYPPEQRLASGPGDSGWDFLWRGRWLFGRLDHWPFEAVLDQACTDKKGTNPASKHQCTDNKGTLNRTVTSRVDFPRQIGILKAHDPLWERGPGPYRPTHNGSTLSTEATMDVCIRSAEHLPICFRRLPGPYAQLGRFTGPALFLGAFWHRLFRYFPPVGLARYSGPGGVLSFASCQSAGASCQSAGVFSRRFFCDFPGFCVRESPCATPLSAERGWSMT